MQRFLDELKSPYWWAAVVVVGLLLNLISSYLRSGIDAVVERQRSQVKRRSASQAAKRRKLIDGLKTSEIERVFLRRRIESDEHLGQLFLAFGAILVIVSGLLLTTSSGDWLGVVGLYLGAIVFVAGGYFRRSAHLRKMELFDAELETAMTAELGNAK